MKIPPANSDSRWEKLLRAARADAGPPADVPALLRAVRQASLGARASWTAEFTALFASGRVIAGCLAGASAFVLVASWHAWDAWQTVPWAQLLDAATGGGS
jgi:hypothetical protein